MAALPKFNFSLAVAFERAIVPTHQLASTLRRVGWPHKARVIFVRRCSREQNRIVRFKCNERLYCFCELLDFPRIKIGANASLPLLVRRNPCPSRFSLTKDHDCRQGRCRSCEERDSKRRQILGGATAHRNSTRTGDKQEGSRFSAPRHLRRLSNLASNGVGVRRHTCCI
jgi:hypothetical protein